MCQYCTNSLYLAKLPGNRYINGIIFGCGEIFAMVFSQFLMNTLPDMTAFRVCYTLGLLSYLSLTFFTESYLMTYVANIMVITSVGGWFNTENQVRIDPSLIQVSSFTKS